MEAKRIFLAEKKGEKCPLMRLQRMPKLSKAESGGPLDKWWGPKREIVDNDLLWPE
jgi:hypothetical protein